ncbi:MAG TPA: hypothetical protein VK577_17635, partial [Bradyrhizobium sp.]|nr:hypothetical protein [Bradyrhizobium sp.]
LISCSRTKDSTDHIHNSAFDGGTIVNPGRQGHDPRRRGAAGMPRVLEEFVHPGSQDISKNTQVKSKSSNHQLFSI